MDDVLRRLALVDEIVRRSIAPTINAHSDALNSISASMAELRQQGYVPATDLASAFERFGSVILQQSQNIQQTKIAELMAQLSETIREEVQRVNRRCDELYLICKAISIGNVGLNMVMTLDDTQQRIVLLSLGDNIPIAVDILNWHVQDNGMLPNLDGTFRRYVDCVKAGVERWNRDHSSEIGNRLYQDIRRMNGAPGIASDLQEMISDVVRHVPIDAIAELGGWRGRC